MNLVGLKSIDLDRKKIFSNSIAAWLRGVSPFFGALCMTMTFGEHLQPFGSCKACQFRVLCLGYALSVHVLSLYLNS